MPFVKVSAYLFINTDLVVAVQIGGKGCTPGTAIITTSDPRCPVVEVSEQAGEYLLTQVESNAALITTPLPKASLTSRLANALRFDFPEGATLIDLEQKFAAEDITRAVAELLAERVIKLSPGGLYYHAANYVEPALLTDVLITNLIKDLPDTRDPNSPRHAHTIDCARLTPGTPGHSAFIYNPDVACTCGAITPTPDPSTEV